MPDLRFNSAFWAGGYDWSSRGEEWSEVWGSSSAQWFGSILPRIRSFVPTRTVLEIAPGFGRWTRYLGLMCDRYYGIDISPECVEHCRKQFQTAHMEFHVNDGTSLAAIPDGSIDFAFSFDSLVHVDATVIESYIKQLVSKLSPTGVAFIHHSNLAALKSPTGEVHMRDPGVSAHLFRNFVSEANGQLLRQEIVTWGTVDSLDCLSLFCRLGAHRVPPTIVTNNKFMVEAIYIRESVAPWEF